MARYGDLDKVLELVNEVNEDGNFTSYAHYSYLFDSIDKLPTIEQPHWIPCSERLPEEDEDVLVCSEEGDIDIACWLPEQWTDEPHIEWWSGEYRVYAVAWMPLPEPYGGESDETD